MLEALFSTASADTSISVTGALVTILVSFLLGGIISLTYMKTCSRGGCSQTFALTMVLLPAVVSVIILLIGSNIARAFSLAGAFSIIRFRSAAGDPKDIAYVLFAMAAGLGCGVGAYGYATLFTVLLCLLMVLLHVTNFGSRKNAQKVLKITIPEDLDYEGAFDDIFEAYTKSHDLRKVKTTDMGSLFELSYLVVMDSGKSQKQFIDAIRCRNGNLSIILSMAAEPCDY